MKRLLLIITAIAVLVFCNVTAFADEQDMNIYLNGEKLDISVEWVDDEVYVPMLACCDAAQARVCKWNAYCENALAVFDDFTIDATAGDNFVTANGRSIYCKSGCIMIDGILYIPAASFAQAMDANYTESGSDIYICAGTEGPESADEYYNSDDLYWLARVIQAEAGGESLEGKVAVGNVVMNRVAYAGFPSNIYDVIFDRNCGVQFSTTIDGSIYNTPSEESYTAAMMAYDGADVVGEALFFASIKDCWAAYNRPYCCSIGNHDFYY